MGRYRFNFGTEKWEKLSPEVPSEKRDISIDDRAFNYCMAVQKDLANDKDHPTIIGGDVGEGKSNLAKVMCRIVSNERFRPKHHTIKNENDVPRVIRNAKPGDAILVDEGSGIFASTDTMTKKSKDATFIMETVRQKNLFITICAPYTHRLSAFLVIDRAKSIWRVYIDKETRKRGKFAYYGTGRKDSLYYQAKKNFGDIRGIEPSYRGKVSKDELYEKEYKEIKDQTLNAALDRMEQNQQKKKSHHEIKLDFQEEFCERNSDKTAKELAVLLGNSERTVQRIRASIKRKREAEARQLGLIS